MTPTEEPGSAAPLRFEDMTPTEELGPAAPECQCGVNGKPAKESDCDDAAEETPLLLFKGDCVGVWRA